MGSTKTKSFDRNRLKKVYPVFRAPPRPGIMTDDDVVLEAIEINFSNENLKTLTLTERYSSIPSISLTPLGDINNVNVWVSAVSIQSVPSGGGKTVTVTVECSAPITGKIHLQAMMV